MKLGSKIILIAGSSHVGKTTLATRLASAMGCAVASTDRLARHPGRPWPTVPKPVADFYEDLSDETIYWFLRAHHENMWPALKRMVDDHVLAGDTLVLEGSALRPEYIAQLPHEDVTRICLCAPETFLRTRIHAESAYGEATDADRNLIDKFVERSVRDNAEMCEAAERHSVALIDVSQPGSIETFCQNFVAEFLAR